MEIESVKLAELVNDPANARSHDQRNIDAIAASLAKFGQQKPIVVNAEGVVIAGNGTLYAAKALDWQKIDIVRTQLEAADAIAYAIADNRTAELAEWDTENLALILDQLNPSELDATGFTEGELGEIMAELGLNADGEPEDAPDAQTDKAEELQEKWQVKRGDLWQIGEHRLLCGDSTSAEDVARLMNGETFNLMVTDPPYGVNYEGGAVNKVKREKLAGDDTTHLIEDFAKVALIAVPSGAWYIWHSDTKASPVYRAIEGSGYEVRALIIWHKLKCGYGAPSAHYLQKHEPCLYAVKGSAGFTGLSTETTVWEYDQPRENKDHPTQKPIPCMKRPIENHSSSVFDPFLGSGTTMVAAQQLNRKCFGLEIEPKYCAVILERMADMGIVGERVDA